MRQRALRAAPGAPTLGFASRGCAFVLAQRFAAHRKLPVAAYGGRRYTQAYFSDCRV